MNRKFFYLIVIFSFIIIFSLIYNCGSQETTIKPLTLEERLNLLPANTKDAVLKDMVLIKGGDFYMGSDIEDPDETPEHLQTLPDFYLDTKEVTNKDFTEFIKSTNYKTTSEKQGFAYVYTGEKWDKVQNANWKARRGEPNSKDWYNHAVVQVSWFDALAYCEWKHKRLPNEAEWEFSAGGKEHTKWPLGNEFNPDDYSAGKKFSEPVGLHKANSFGLFDMGGGVWEWTNSLYEFYPYSIKDGREDIKKDGKRVPRGGSWANWTTDARVFRCANRSTNGQPDNCYENIGFRCAF